MAISDANDGGPRRIGVREFRGDMTRFLQEVRQGHSFLLTSHNEVVAELRPPLPSSRPARVPGALRGSIRMTEDFDTLPRDIMEAIEGGSL